MYIGPNTYPSKKTFPGIYIYVELRPVYVIMRGRAGGVKRTVRQWHY